MTKEEIMSYCGKLTQFDTPTISNALECFSDFKKGTGFMDYTIKSAIPCTETFVGPAATARIATEHPATAEEAAKMMPYYQHIKDMGPGCIVVQQDMDPKPVGSFWGEVNATQHKALGCQGVVTSGGVRDLKEVAGLGFGYFAKEVVVSHAYTHVVDFGCKVTVGGLEVEPGDIIACDMHGVIKIPIEYLPDMERACRNIALAELPVLEPCRRAIMNGETVEIEDLKEWRAGMAQARKDSKIR
jgi:4-hydroxy-4-methyl-2-oxoglutarate aldolase